MGLLLCSSHLPIPVSLRTIELLGATGTHVGDPNRKSHRPIRRVRHKFLRENPLVPQMREFSGSAGQRKRFRRAEIQFTRIPVRPECRSIARVSFELSLPSAGSKSGVESCGWQKDARKKMEKSDKSTSSDCGPFFAAHLSARPCLHTLECRTPSESAGDKHCRQVNSS